jgi:hypothetical protein
MDAAFRPDAWHDFYLMVGGAAAALTGLIFVAVSLHLRPVLGDPWHRGRAGSSLLALVSVLLISGAVLIPDQPLPALGVEVGLLALASPAYNVRGLTHLRRERRLDLGVELAIGLCGAALAVLSGISLILETGPGLWLLLPAGAVALGSSVWNAWRLMVGVAIDDETEARRG